MKIENVFTFAMIASAITCTVTGATAKADSYIDPLAQTYFVAEDDSVGLLKLRRVYSSTTLFRGQFGAGWCSELDARLQFYGAGEMRFRSCDLETAQLIDLPAKNAGIKRTATGFTRLRGDGVVQNFSHDGLLLSLSRKDGRISLRRDSEHRLQLMMIESSKGRSTHEITTGRNQDGELATIRSIGLNNRYEYGEALLVRAPAAAYEYDDLLNMTTRTTGDLAETIAYERSTDRVVQIRRVPTFGSERLLVAIKREGKSERTEIRIEVERGAETRPVLILYNRTTRRLSLEGDREVARLILNWIRT